MPICPISDNRYHYRSDTNFKYVKPATSTPCYKQNSTLMFYITASESGCCGTQNCHKHCVLGPHSCLWALTMNHTTAITVICKELVELQCATCCMDFRRTSRESTVLCTRVHVKLHMMITKCNTANKFQPDTATVMKYNTANIKPAFRGVMANLGTGNSSPVQKHHIHVPLHGCYDK